MTRPAQALLMLVLALSLPRSGLAEGAAPAADQSAAAASSDAGLAAYQARTRTAIEDVLKQREFADVHDDSNAIWRNVIEWIESLLRPLGHLPRWVGQLMLFCFILALAAMLAYLIYSLWTALGGAYLRGPGGPARRKHAGELLGIRELDFDAVYAEAGRLLKAGDWAAATRHLYVAAILWLDRQGCVAFRLSKTNRDYIRELQGRARFQTRFRSLTDGFESIAYGGRAATSDTSHDMLHTIEGMFHETAGAIAG